MLEKVFGLLAVVTVLTLSWLIGVKRHKKRKSGEYWHGGV